MVLCGTRSNAIKRLLAELAVRKKLLNGQMGWLIRTEEEFCHASALPMLCVFGRALATFAILAGRGN